MSSNSFITSPILAFNQILSSGCLRGKCRIEEGKGMRIVLGMTKESQPPLGMEME